MCIYREKLNFKQPFKLKKYSEIIPSKTIKISFTKSKLFTNYFNKM